MKTPMSYFGGKTRIAERIAAVLPEHQHYLEPFAGSLAVLLAKPPSKHETVNDIDAGLMTFWRVLRDRPDELMRACALTPHCRREQQETYETDGLDELEVARRVWVQVSQSRAGLRSKTGWRQYIDPAGTNTAMPAYLEAYIVRMAAVVERLHNVSLESRPALELITSFGRVPEVLIYADPPYLGSVRASASGRYLHDMQGATEHEDLLAALLACRCAVVVSGYASPMYEAAFKDWDRVEIPTITGQATGNNRRIEVLWSNRQISAQHLFSDSEVSA